MIRLSPRSVVQHRSAAWIVCGDGTIWAGDQCVGPDSFLEQQACVEYPNAPECIDPNCKEDWCCGAGTTWESSTCMCVLDECPGLCPLVTSWLSINNKQGGEGVTAPEKWESFPGSGTSEDDIDWLYCWDIAPDPGNVGDNLLSGIACFRDFLSAAEKKAIVDECKTKATKLEKALCAGQAVRALFSADDDLVCRHHAIALESVLESLGIGAGIEASFKEGGGHAWTTATIDGKMYLLDSYNEIYICVSP
jgi:hypothetical protein